jgi:translation initiation factor IF-2
VATKVHELAKELGMTGKELVEKAKTVGINLKGHMAPVDDKQARILRAMFPPPSPEEMSRRAAAERAKKAKTTPKAKKKKVKKKVVKKKAVAKTAEEATAAPEAALEEGAIGVSEAAPEDAQTAPAAEVDADARAAAVKKKAAKKKEKPQKKKSRPPEPIIKFQFVGEADAAPVEAVDDSEGKADEVVAEPVPVPVPDEVPRTRIEALLADRRWEKLGIVSRVKSARAQAESRFGGRSRHGGRNRRRSARGGQSQRGRQISEQPKGEVEITLPITVRKLSERLGRSASVLLGKLLEHGTPSGINDILTMESAQLVALEFDVELKVRKERDLEEELADLLAKESHPDHLAPRAPVVTFMGHVDHGKTSLLDKIRETNVAGGEAGGITQRIGAYTVPRPNGFIAFIDTPGHKAFTEMRARGAHVTDIVVLVVAADDGIMPQTEEAISHARAAKVPIIVALNKMDLPNANPMRAKQQLASLELSPEEWGGHTGVIECSAETGKGIEALLDRISLEAELLDLKAEPGRHANGFVLEAKMTDGRGIVATVLVRDGTLNKSDVILSSHGYGRVRGLFDHTGKTIDSAGPSMPIEVTGLSELPDAGDRFYVLENLERAREIADERAQATREAKRAVPRHVTLETLSERIGQEETIELKVVLKADLKGVLDALVPQLEGQGNKEATVTVMHQAVGAINTSDILLADASGGVVVGFDVGVDAAARQLAESRGVDIRLHKVIYDLVDEVRASLEGKLVPEEKEVVTGHADVRQTFRISKAGSIAGCMILDGTIERQNKARVSRGGTIVFEGTISGLKHFKDDVREVRQGFECGIKIEGFDDTQVGDQIEAYRVEKVARRLS